MGRLIVRRWRFSLNGRPWLLPFGFLAVWPLWGELSQRPWTILWDRAVPATIETVSDLRWAADDSLFLAAGKKGVVKLAAEPSWGLPASILPVGSFLWTASSVGASNEYLASSGPAYSVAWRKLPSGKPGAGHMDLVVDLDVRGNQLLVLGARKDAKDRFAPDGAIAWLVALQATEVELKPIRFSKDGAGARSMGDCGAFETGSVRFLADGYFVVVPGVEPGVYLHDAQGKLIRVWDTKELGLDAECGLSYKDSLRLSADLGARSAWINQRRVLEDIVPLPDGSAGLIVRHVAGGKTLWELKVLSRSGSVTARDLPFTGPSPHWHLRADVRGPKLAFLLKEYEPTLKHATSRIVVTTAPW